MLLSLSIRKYFPTIFCLPFFCWEFSCVIIIPLLIICISSIANHLVFGILKFYNIVFRWLCVCACVCLNLSHWESFGFLNLRLLSFINSESVSFISSSNIYLSPPLSSPADIMVESLYPPWLLPPLSCFPVVVSLCCILCKVLQSILTTPHLSFQLWFCLLLIILLGF